MKEILKRKIEEFDNEYIGRIYRNKCEYELTNTMCKDVINDELGTSYAESTLRGIAKIFNETYELILERMLNKDNNECLKGLEIKKKSLEVESNKQIKEQEKELDKIKKEKEKYEKELDKLDAKEEKRLRVVENGDYYTISSNKRDIKVSKEKVKEIKKIYCDENGIGISQLCRQLDLPRRDFMLIKYAFNIVHDDVPYLDEELEDENNIESLVEDTLERKKERYFLKLQEQEIESMKQEIKIYRGKDYLYNKIVERLREIEIYPIQYNVEVKHSNKKRSARLDLADMHVGIKSYNYFNKYDVDIAYSRAEELTNEVITTCAELGVTNLSVANLGDCVCGIIHDSLIKESEITIDEQVKVATEIILKMLIDFSKCGVFEEVTYESINGNHGRIFAQKDKSTEKENFESFVIWGLQLALQGKDEYSNVKFVSNVVDDTVIISEIEGVKIYTVHGHLDRFNKVVSDLGLMFGKSDEVHIAHYHHNKSEEFHMCEVFMGRAFSGVDTYAKNARCTSKAGQRLYIYSEGEREFIRDIIFK